MQPKSYPTGLIWTMRMPEGVPGNQLNPDRKAVAKTKRRIEITVEKHRVVVLSRRNQSINGWCEECGEQVQMVTPDEAAQLCSITARTIYRWIETERLHFTETEKGFSLICLQSIDSNAANSTEACKEGAQTKPSGGGFRKGLMKRMLKRH
jgi:excisionase family DNA binding protein